jgi:hypothetical protein
VRQVLRVDRVKEKLIRDQLARCFKKQLLLVFASQLLAQTSKGFLVGNDFVLDYIFTASLLENVFVLSMSNVPSSIQPM